MSEQTIDDVEMAVVSGTHKSFVEIYVDKHLARVEHLLHKRHLTMGSVLTKCVKLERHLRAARRDSEFKLLVVVPVPHCHLHSLSPSGAGCWRLATSQIERQNDELSQRIEAERQARSKAEKAKNASEATNAELRGKLTGLEKARLGVDQNTKRLEGEVAKLKQRVADEEVHRNNFESDLKKSAAENVRLGEEIIQLQKRNQALQRKLSLFVELVSTEAPKLQEQEKE